MTITVRGIASTPEQLAQLQADLAGGNGLEAARLAGPAKAQVDANKRNLRERLKDSADRGSRQYLFPDALPVIVSQGQWVASTIVYNGEFRASGNSVYVVSGFTTASTSQGTTGAVAPTGTGNAITDGEVVWCYVGYLAPVARANSQTIYAGQIVYSGGVVQRAQNDGTTAAGTVGPAPVGGTITDGTVTFAYEGVQTKPLISLNTVVGAGLSINTGVPKSGIPWNSPSVSVLGGTMIQNGANARGGVASRSIDGNPYIESNVDGGGSIFTLTDAPSTDFTFTGGGSATNQQALTAWSDGELIALVCTNNSSQRWINLNYNGVRQSRRVRTLRFMVPYSMKFAGFTSTTVDVFQAYTPADTVKAVHMGDSFTGGAAGIPYCLLYATKTGMALGIDDYRVSGLGGTGVLQPNGSSVPYGTRFTVDMINQNPDISIIQSSGNDANGVNSGTFTTDQVRDALSALFARVKAETPLSQLVTISVWNNRGPLSAPHSTINANAIAAAQAANVPVIDWSNYLTDGGYVGHLSSSGNSGIYTSENTHPTYLGHDYRSRLITSSVKMIWNGL